MCLAASGKCFNRNVHWSTACSVYVSLSLSLSFISHSQILYTARTRTREINTSYLNNENMYLLCILFLLWFEALLLLLLHTVHFNYLLVCFIWFDFAIAVVAEYFLDKMIVRSVSMGKYEIMRFRNFWLYITNQMIVISWNRGKWTSILAIQCTLFIC